MQFRRHYSRGIAAHLPVAELYLLASTVQADSGGEGWVKKPSGKTGLHKILLDRQPFNNGTKARVAKPGQRR
jgi:hypothetical protein